MARKPVVTGGKKDELIAAAFTLFMQNGYENTSVRMILGAVNGEVGMFYHYFRSKADLFEAAVSSYFARYADEFNRIGSNVALPLPVILQQIFALFQTTAQTYLRMKGSLHWTVELALRQKTLEQLEPCIATLLQRAVDTGQMQPPSVNCRELAAFLVQGTAGFVHRQAGQQADAALFARKKHDVICLIANVLSVDPQWLEGEST